MRAPLSPPKKMEIKIPYGSGEEAIRLPPDTEIDFLRPADASPMGDIEGSFVTALEKPVNSRPLGDLLGPDSTVVILVSDITRAKGSEQLLPLLIRFVKDAGVSGASITVLVARGTHRKMTKEERTFFTRPGLSGVVVKEHDCDDTSSLSALLLTQRGTPVRMNAALRDIDTVILLSPVSFHYFAGFGGGRKLILPGSTDRASIVANHRLSLVDGDPVRIHAKCHAGNLEGNPIHEDMIETLGALDGVFGINFFSGTSGDLLFVNAGEPVRAHEEACEAYRKVYERPVKKNYQVAVVGAGGLPYDINFLQSHKGIRHASSVLADGGSMLYFAECGEGVGSAKLESALAMDKKKFLKSAWQDYELNNTTAVSLHDLTDRHEIGMVSAMNVDVLLSCGIKSCVNREAFLAEALEKHGTNRVAVIPHGSTTLPQLVGDGER